MKRSLSLHESTNLSCTSRPLLPGTDEHATPDGEEQQGLIHLLENNTFDELLEKMCDEELPDDFEDDDPTTEDSAYSDDNRRLGKGMTEEGKDIITFLSKGRLPDDKSRRSVVANMVLRLNEPKLLLALLKLGNFDLMVETDRNVAALIDAANLASTTVFQDIGLKLGFGFSFDKDAFIDKLVSLIESDQGFNGILIVRDYLPQWEMEDHHLKKLFDALSKTTKPKFSTIEDALPVPDVFLRHLANLMDASSTVHTFELASLLSKDWTLDAKDVYQMLLQRLKQQTRLEVLHIAATTAWEQELIGHFVESNHSIKRLRIDMRDPCSAPSLIRGLKKNRSLETLNLCASRVFDSTRATTEHSLLPLLSIFKKNNCSASRLTLDFRQCEVNDIAVLVDIGNEFEKGQTFIESLLTNNTTLNSLTLIFPACLRVNLLPLGSGIKRNRTLETLKIEFFGSRYSSNSIQLFINPDTIPSFLSNVAKNTTLSDILVGGISGTNSRDDETLQHIVSRNARFQKYACSSSYLRGAISGFLVTKELPTDVTQSLQKYLDDQHPLAVTRALAGVNRASNNWAHAVRRDESAAQLERVLEPTPRDHKAGVKELVDLLGMMLARKKDFANDVLSRIKQSVFLPDALVHWLSKDPSTFKILAKRLNEAGGMQISRKQVVGDYVRRYRELPDIYRRLQLLEKKFTPDQSHLAGFMNEQVDYRSVGPDELQAFVGYDFVDPVSDFNAVFEWCAKNSKAELYVAYMANFPDRWLSTDRMLPAFRLRFLSALASSRQVRLLQIVDFGLQEDAATIDSLLSDGSLEYLTLSNARCMEVDFKLILDRLAANIRLKQLEIGFSSQSDTFALIEKIRRMFQANQVLERLTLCVSIDHPEYAALEELASVERRFQLQHNLPVVDNDSSDA